MDEDSTRRYSRDDKLKIVIDHNSSNNNNKSYVVPVVTTVNNSEIANDAAATAAVEEPGENEGDELFKPLRIISKVPLQMRNHENNKGLFDPKAVSIGPYHHGKPELQFVENFKPMVATLFVSDSASGKNRDEFYNEVLGKVNEARSYYVEGSTDQYTREEFANMMFLDGCFILAMIEIESNILPGLKSKYVDLVTHLGVLVWSSSCGDIIFLLENQLPFEVLELLMRLKFKEDEGLEMIHSFVDYLISVEFEHIQKEEEVEVSETNKPPLHLLQLVLEKHLNLPIHIFEYQSSTKKDKSVVLGTQRPVTNLLHRVGLSGARNTEAGYRPFTYPRKLKDFVHSFHSVTELKAKGIHFRRSSSFSIKAIKFESSFFFFGRLQLPPLIVIPETKMHISNFIAYELCFGNPDSLPICSFFSFLKSLIYHPDDVKELRSKRILFNALGSDEQVVNVFKEITTFAVEDVKIYQEVKQSIQDHCNSIVKTWMAEFIHKYFSRPWTVIAFIAATSLLILAVLQTCFTISSQSGHK